MTTLTPSTPRRNLLRLIAAFQIYCGLNAAILGGVALFKYLFLSEALTGVVFGAMAFCLAPIAFGALATVAGILLLEGKTKGLSLSMWTQAIAVPLLISPPLTFSLPAGPAVKIWLGQASGLSWQLPGQPAVGMDFNHVWAVGVDVVPILVLLFLAAIRRARSVEAGSGSQAQG